ncbi:MAG: GspE/PulE family protein [Firmicutes bacterium]|nr:GspE/PulE family protein [Bacillota bacterium]
MAELLVKKGIVSQDDLAVIESRVNGDMSLIEALVSSGLVSSSAISELVGIKDFSIVDLSEYNINPEAVSLLPEAFARRYQAIPIDFENQKLVVAMADPINVLISDDLHMVTGRDIKTVAALESEIEAAINHYYKATEVIQEEISGLDPEDGQADLSKIRAVSEEAPVIKLVNTLIIKAVNERVSDIHIEPQEKDLRVRYRVDGVLKEVMRSPKHIQAGIISRLKVMANLDIAETRVPQDGHCDLNVAGNVVDFRVATLPTIYGERVVLRILRKESILLNLDDLGFLPDSLSKFKSSFNKPYGAVLVTGPTGSGKSTTLYAALNILNSSNKNIITVEDPVEYRLPGINQVNVNTKAGLTFAKVLKAVLRASPDIVMVGEIRDKETAQIAIEAALTGHLVLSTLHTNDAPSAISRLTEMGIAPFLTSSALECVQAQRLARRLCPDCKEPYEPSIEALQRIGFPLRDGEKITLYKANGCPRCNGTGYKGRIGIYEVMPFSEAIEELCVKRATVEEIKRVAIVEGMKTLRQDGYEKVKLGITSLEEIMRVIV